MPNVDVVDLKNQKVGELELADQVFGAEVNEALLYEAVRNYLAGHAPARCKTKVRSGSGRLRQEAVEAKRHRTRPHGLGPLPDMAARRHGARAAAARLQLSICRARCSRARCARR